MLTGSAQLLLSHTWRHLSIDTEHHNRASSLCDQRRPTRTWGDGRKLNITGCSSEWLLEFSPRNLGSLIREVIIIEVPNFFSGSDDSAALLGE